jgi:S-adenosylmethionine hydrolase
MPSDRFGSSAAGNELAIGRATLYNVARPLASGLSWNGRVAAKVEGKVVAYSDAGNLVTDIPHDRLSNLPAATVTVTCDEHQTIGIYPADHKEEPFTLMAILGPSGFLELTIVGESAKAMLGVRLGEKVVIKG